MWCLHTVEYYCTIKKDMLEAFESKWRLLGTIMLTEINQMQTFKSRMVFLIQETHNIKRK